MADSFDRYSKIMKPKVATTSPRRSVMLGLLATSILPVAQPARAARAEMGVQQVQQLIRAFRATQDTNAIAEAISLADQLSADRSSKVRPLWQEIIRALDAEIIPGFDTADVPLLNVAPPPESGLPAGVAPDSVEDPVMRAAYKKALAENALRLQRYRYQRQPLEQMDHAQAGLKEYTQAAGGARR
ncbi:hypothetical protein FHW83_005643 [Duganella sp. SG902]|uniref:hypothetical protein n=1 Tax=Duganella sp. SG902 TaxID=2587016 RepID=UPI00159DBB01|nr:hypothetical protein [Duganella sp. SG902]NVM79801.1 hypothetical protein [Duganella sp. SG902]